MPGKVGIIGGGPAGHAAAVRLSVLGAEVTLFEADLMGGTCLNRGCIPAKCLLTSSEAYHTACSGRDYGFAAEGLIADAALMVDRKNNVVKRQRSGMEKGLKNHGINIVQGTANINGRGEISCNENKYNFDAILIATGSEPIMLNGFDEDDSRIMTSTEVMDIREFPKRALVIGAGYIGMELGSWLSTCGAEVVIAEALSAPLPGEEPDLVKKLVALLKRRKIKFSFQTMAEYVGASDQSVMVKLGDAVQEFDLVLVAAGRRSVAQGFVPDEIMENGIIAVDSRLRTKLPGIWAAGDCNGGIMLAHVASAEGIAAAMDIAVELDLNTAMFPAGSYADIKRTELVPAAIYTAPELASVGARTHLLKEQGISFVAADARFASNGRAAAGGALDGQVRLIAEPVTLKLLGASILGAHASELIQELCIAVTKGLTAYDIAGCIHGHPTMSEAVYEASLELINKPEESE